MGPGCWNLKIPEALLNESKTPDWKRSKTTTNNLSVWLFVLLFLCGNFVFLMVVLCHFVDFCISLWLFFNSVWWFCVSWWSFYVSSFLCLFVVILHFLFVSICSHLIDFPIRNVTCSGPAALGLCPACPISNPSMILTSQNPLIPVEGAPPAS